MPYIDPSRRASLNPHIQKLGNHALTPGELNYAITRLVMSRIDMYGASYDAFNEIIGILECVKQEIYRRAVARYEDQKMQSSGDVPEFREDQRGW